MKRTQNIYWMTVAQSLNLSFRSLGSYQFIAWSALPFSMLDFHLKSWCYYVLLNYNSCSWSLTYNIHVSRQWKLSFWYAMYFLVDGTCWFCLIPSFLFLWFLVYFVLNSMVFNSTMYMKCKYLGEFFRNCWTDQQTLESTKTSCNYWLFLLELVAYIEQYALGLWSNSCSFYLFHIFLSTSLQVCIAFAS